MAAEPRFILSRRMAAEQYCKAKGAADEVSYSVKTNPELCRILEGDTDSFFSVHFIKSLRFVKDTSRVWLISQALSNEALENAFESGVRRFVVDNENDLCMLVDFIEGKDVMIDLLLRMRLKEHTVKTGKYFVYGMYSERINELIPKLRENKRIGRLGIHFHRKTQNTAEWSVKEELDQSLSEKTLELIDVVNIGGGIPIVYKNYPNDLSEAVLGRIKELRAWLNSKGIRMILEPGRFIAAPCIKLEAKIINIYSGNIILNCSVYNSAMDTFVADIRLMVEGEKESGSEYLIKGCTPDSMDIFRYRVFLDEKKIGDRIVFLNAGAYTYSTDFCGLEKIRTEIEE